MTEYEEPVPCRLSLSGYTSEFRSGSAVRAYRRTKYPNHLPYKPWILN
jgi:hypothetical protein